MMVVIREEERKIMSYVNLKAETRETKRHESRAEPQEAIGDGRSTFFPFLEILDRGNTINHPHHVIASSQLSTCPFALLAFRVIIPNLAIVTQGLLMRPFSRQMLQGISLSR